MRLHVELPVSCRFKQSNIVVLHDKQPHSEYWPTKVRAAAASPSVEADSMLTAEHQSFCPGLCHAWHLGLHIPQQELPAQPVWR